MWGAARAVVAVRFSRRSSGTPFVRRGMNLYERAEIQRTTYSEATSTLPPFTGMPASRIKGRSPQAARARGEPPSTGRMTARRTPAKTRSSRRGGPVDIRGRSRTQFTVMLVKSELMMNREDWPLSYRRHQLHPYAGIQMVAWHTSPQNVHCFTLVDRLELFRCGSSPGFADVARVPTVASRGSVSPSHVPSHRHHGLLLTQRPSSPLSLPYRTPLITQPSERTRKNGPSGEVSCAAWREDGSGEWASSGAPDTHL